MSVLMRRRAIITNNTHDDGGNGLRNISLNNQYWSGLVSNGIVTLANQAVYQKILLPLKHTILLHSGDVVILMVDVIRTDGLAYHGIGMCSPSVQETGIDFDYGFYYNGSASKLGQVNSVTITDDFEFASIGFYTRTSTVSGLQFKPHITVNGQTIF